MTLSIKGLSTLPGFDNAIACQEYMLLQGPSTRYKYSF